MLIKFPLRSSIQYFFLFSMAMLLAACWQRQSHNLLLPETPHYQLTGHITDIDSGEILGGTSMIITATQMIYAVDWLPTTIFADSSGFFTVDTIYPGSYSMTVYRDGYPVLDVPLFISHADRNFDIEVPTPLSANQEIPLNDLNPGGSWPAFTMQAGPLWIMGLYSGFIGRSYVNKIDGLMSITISGNILDVQRGYNNPAPHAKGLIFGQNLLYAYYANKVDVISTSTGQTISTLTLVDLLSGLTFYDGIFYATWGSSIQNRGTDIIREQGSVHTEAGALGSIVRWGNYFWAYDTDRGFVLKIDQDGDIINTFRPFYQTSASPVEVFEISIDLSGDLWISGGTGHEKRLFEYSGLTD